ncbi:hypothetical protein JCM11251_005712 [Rhodosporidiobolus azoricus]
MPPKPKGLKASKRAAPFDPSSLTSSSSEPIPSTSASPALNKEQTAPLDDDALTLADLYELRSNVSEILYPFPHSLRVEIDPERVDEARSLLRGILHGCAVLEPFVAQEDYGYGKSLSEEEAERDFGRFVDPERAEEKVDQRIKDLGHDKAKALGLRGAFTEGWIVALQTFALIHLAELFEPAESNAAVSALQRQTAPSGPSKRRKIDVREPKTRLEWLEAAYSRAFLLYHGLAHGAYMESEPEPSTDRMMAFFDAEHKSTLVAYLGELVKEKGEDDDEVEELVEEKEEFALKTGNPSEVEHWGVELEDTTGYEVVDSDEVVRAALRAWSAWVALVEAHPSLLGEADEMVEKLKTEAKKATELSNEHFKHGAATELHEKQGVDVVEENQVQEWRFLLDVVAADAVSARFLILEDRVEAKYRPDAGSEEDEGDEEGEVTPLPDGAEEVVKAKEASKEAIAAVRATLVAHDELPKEVRHPEGKRAQYRKLEEVLLVSSALINPSDKEATDKIEKEIEEVRKEGGLDEEGDEEEAEGETK